MARAGVPANVRRLRAEASALPIKTGVEVLPEARAKANAKNKPDQLRKSNTPNTNKPPGDYETEPTARA